jgi:hypothetical protein
MSNLKCPFCQQELVGTIGHPICRNQDCVMCDDPMPQDLLEELIRTRKEFEVAVDGLLAVWRATDCTTKQGSIAYNVLRDLNIKPLDRIKALEQKD